MEPGTKVWVFFVIFGCFLFVPTSAIEPIDQETIMGYVITNADKIHSIEPEFDYPEDWNCVDISNDYMRRNPEWCILEIYVPGAPLSHAVNFKIIDDVIHVRDDYWEIGYRFEDWRNMSLSIYECGVEIPKEAHKVYINVKEY